MIARMMIMWGMDKFVILGAYLEVEVDTVCWVVIVMDSCIVIQFLFISHR